MAVSKAREQSYLRALMFLGPAPKIVKVKHAGVKTSSEVALETDSYIRSMKYHGKLDHYFMFHVFQGPTSALGNTDTWIEDFLNWQKERP